MAQEIDLNPRNPEAARAQLERTRARMSETIDEIEDVILKKKQDIQEKIDIGARIREKPLHAAGIVLGVGFLIGFLSGGKSDTPVGGLAADARAALWEGRARRLLRIARENEDRIDELEDAVVELETLHAADEDWDPDPDGDLEYDDLDDEGPSRISELKDAIMARATRLIDETGRTFIDNVRSRL